MIARDDDEGHPVLQDFRIRHAERVPVALDDERRHGHRGEFWKAGLLGPAGRMQRERQAQHSRGPDLTRRTTGDPATEGATTYDQWEVIGMHLLGDCTPRRVDLRRRCGCLSPGDSIGLLDEDNREVRPNRLLGRERDVMGGHAAASTVAKHDQPNGIRRRVSDMDARVTVRGRDEGDRELGHAGNGTAPAHPEGRGA